MANGNLQVMIGKTPDERAIGWKACLAGQFVCVFNLVNKSILDRQQAVRAFNSILNGWVSIGSDDPTAFQKQVGQEIIEAMPGLANVSEEKQAAIKAAWEEALKG